jgi:hypothetical protein
MPTLLWKRSEIPSGNIWPKSHLNSPLAGIQVFIPFFEQILKTQATAPVIVADITCPNGHNVDRNRSSTCNGEVIVFGRPGLSLQACLDDFVLTLHTRCPTCSSYLSHTSTFAQTPPLLAFDLGNNFDSTIPMDPVLEINCQGSCKGTTPG